MDGLERQDVKWSSVRAESVDDDVKIAEHKGCG
jgi:hypothetical protein